MQTILDLKRNGRIYSFPKIFIITGSFILVLSVVSIYRFFSADKSEILLERNSLRIAEVSLGAVTKYISATGNLVSNQRQWISAETSSRVVERLLEPGAEVTPDSVILKLHSPQLMKEYKQALMELKVAEANLVALQEEDKEELREQSFKIKLLSVEISEATNDFEAKRKLRELKIIPENIYSEAFLKLERLKSSLENETYRNEVLPNLHNALMKAEKAKVDQKNLEKDLLREQIDSLEVKARMKGILQSVSVEVGQEISPGMELARVASQANLRAELRVPESQIKDVREGLQVTIDTRRTRVSAQITRVHPSVVNGSVTVDAHFLEDLPKEARPDLRVEGLIRVDHREDVLVVDKPYGWVPEVTSNLFVLYENREIRNANVEFGLDSVDRVEVIRGLKSGDLVVLSDLQKFEGFKSLKLK